MQTIRQLDHNDTDILRHGEEHLTQVLRLHLQLGIRLLSIAGQRDLLQFRHTVYQKRHVISEFSPEVILRHHSIFHHIVQNTCHDGLLIQLQIRQNDSHIQRMDDIGFPGLPELVLVSLAGNLIGFLDHRDIITGMIFLHTLNKLLI